MEKDKEISKYIVEIEEIKQNHTVCKRKLSQMERTNKRLKDRISEFWECSV